VEGLTGGVSAERNSGRIQRGKDISEAPADATPTPASSRLSRAAVSLGAQARRLACKIKTSSDFSDAELQRKADPCAHKCSDHCQNLDGNRDCSAMFQGWLVGGMRERPRNRGSIQMTRNCNPGGRDVAGTRGRRSPAVVNLQAMPAARCWICEPGWIDARGGKKTLPCGD
jgi:hypothetical protein